MLGLLAGGYWDRVRVLGCVACMCLVAGAGSADTLGRVVYAQTAQAAANGPVEIVEKDLDTGKTTTLIPTSAFPAKLNDNTTQIAVSPDGRFVALMQGLNIDKMMSDIDEAVKANKPSPPLDPEDYGAVLWDREKSQFRQLPKNLDAMRLLWSPSGGRLLVVVAPKRPAVVWSDAGSRECGPLDFTWDLAWSADGQNVIWDDSPDEKGSTIMSAPIGGEKPAKLFAWPDPIESLAVCPKGAGYSIYDGKAISILDANGKKLRDVGVSLRKAFIVEMAYDVSGEKLAILVRYTVGEGLVDQFEGPEVTRLYWAEVKTGKFEKLAELCQTRVDGDGNARTTSERHLAGWLPGGKSILVSGQISWGGKGPIGEQCDRFALWRMPTSARIPTARSCSSIPTRAARRCAGGRLCRCRNDAIYAGLDRFGGLLVLGCVFPVEIRRIERDARIHCVADARDKPLRSIQPRRRDQQRDRIQLTGHPGQVQVENVCDAALRVLLAGRQALQDTRQQRQDGGRLAQRLAGHIQRLKQQFARFRLIAAPSRDGCQVHQCLWAEPVLAHSFQIPARPVLIRCVHAHAGNDGQRLVAGMKLQEAGRSLRPPHRGVRAEAPSAQRTPERFCPLASPSGGLAGAPPRAFVRRRASSMHVMPSR